MEGQLPKQTQNQFYQSQSIKIKANQLGKTEYKLFRKRSVTSLHKQDYTPSPNHRKQKYLIYKKDLLQQKFHNLQLNNLQRQGKKPLKLKLQRLNKQNNLVVMKQLSDISNEIQTKFETQNSLIKKSLQRMESLVTKNSSHHTISRIDLSKKNKSENKLTENKDNQIQKHLKVQVEQLTQKNHKLEEEIKSVKTINNFLIFENYKLSMENSMLKSKIIQLEQADYQNNMKTNEDMYCEYNKNSMSSRKINQQKLTEEIQKPESNHSIFIVTPLQKKSNTQEILINQIQTQNFSSQNKQIQQNNQIKVNSNLQDTSSSRNESQNLQLLQQFQQLTTKINSLEQQLDVQKSANDELSNQMALLKLRNHTGNFQQNKRRREDSFESAVSIRMDLNERESSKNQKSNENYHSNLQLIKSTAKKSELSLESIHHKASKSKILSNQIIYFAQSIPSQNQKYMQFRNSTESKNKVDQICVNDTLIQQILPLDIINEVDEDQKKKTLCMKKIQMPTEEIKKRRKSISDKLNICIEKKQKNINFKNNLSFCSNQRVNLLQMIRETISFKFYAFKYTFELFQNQMIQWPNGKATSKQLKSILSEYPFFLDEGWIQLLFGHCNIMEGKDTRVDIFCNKLREFISDYEQMSEQEEVVLEKKIYKRWKHTKEEILQIMKKNESAPGEITKSGFISALEEFKYEDKQIHYLLCHCVALSSDINHINYRHYLDNFLTKK